MVQLNPFDMLGCLDVDFGDLILPRSLPREGCRSKRCRCRGAGGPSRLAVVSRPLAASPPGARRGAPSVKRVRRAREESRKEEEH